MYIIEYQPPTAVNRWRHRRKIRKMGKDVTRSVAVPLVGLYLALAVLILLWTVDAIGEVVAVNEDSLLNIRAEPDVDASLRGALAPGARPFRHHLRDRFRHLDRPDRRPRGGCGRLPRKALPPA